MLVGGGWTFLLNSAQRGLGLLGTLVVARFLGPAEVGLMGIALLVISLVEALTTFGVTSALIQREGDIEPFLDTAWAMRIIRCTAQAVLLVAIAPLVARFFGSPEATAIIRVVAISVFLGGFLNTAIVQLDRELEFRTIFLYKLSETVAYLVVAVTLAILLRSAWAMVWAELSTTLVVLVLSYVFRPRRPRLRFELDRAKSLYLFGRWVLASRLLSYVTEEGDDVLIGRLLGAESLGLYRMSYRLANLPATEAVGGMSSVLFPAYSRLQRDTASLARAFVVSLKLASFVAWPLVAGIVVVAPEVTLAFLGEGWIEIVPVVRALSVYVLLRSYGWLNAVLLEGKGRPEVAAKVAFLQVALFAVLAYPLTVRWEMIGMAAAITLPLFVSQIVGSRVVLKALDLSPVQLMSALWAPALASAVMVGALAPLRLAVGPWLSLSINVLLGAAVYGAAMWLLHLAGLFRVTEAVAEIRRIREPDPDRVVEPEVRQ